MNVIRIIPIILLIITSCTIQPKTNGKKIYADYHGVRYTRPHDGKLGRWEMYADTKQSATGQKTINLSADLIDTNGRHKIAATAYPQTGLQSNLDPDYLEYQILSAKTAGIDGFFIEWGFLPHENDILLRAMQKQAAKYNFEISVNWCDGWLYYDWITKIYPEINNRSAKTDYMVRCYQYLIDSVFTGPTAPRVNGRPVFYRFGAGATGAGASIEEYQSVLDRLHYPYGMQTPAVLLRWADWGSLENDKYIPIRQSDIMDGWKALGEIPTPWLPARVRPRDEQHPHWDHYAEPEDLIEFLKPFRDSIWLSPNPAYTVKSGFVMPGMDNHGCAGWGRGHFYLIPRNQGQTYRDMWDFCMQSRDSLDMIFIASWSDYTEGHEIEPTIENGDRELRTTLEYASIFKDADLDPSSLELPLQLFHLRKKNRFLGALKGNPNRCDELESSVSEIDGILDEAAVEIAAGKYRKAAKKIAAAQKHTDVLTRKVTEEKVIISDFQATASLPDELARKLRNNHWTGYITFEYKDDGQEYLFVRSATDKDASKGFDVVGKLRTDGSGEWKTARMALAPENIVYRDGQPAFRFSKGVEIKNIGLEYSIYRIGEDLVEPLRHSDGSYSFTHRETDYKVAFMAPDIIHIQALPQGDSLAAKRLVVDARPYTEVQVRIRDGRIGFLSSQILAEFDLATGLFCYRDSRSGELILSEAGRRFEGLSVSQSFRTSGGSDEGLYGLGQFQNGILDYRGQSVRLVHSNMDIACPYLVSSRGYGLLWDCYSATDFSDDGSVFTFDSEVADASDYYLLWGRDMDGAAGLYRKLTGRSPMFAKWAFGFWQSKERYRSFDELSEVAGEYRRRGIPLDNIVQDWEYWGDKAHWNSLKFNPEHFPEPKTAIARLHDSLNVRLMLSVWPGFGPKTDVYSDLDSIGALFDERTWAGYKVFDAYNPYARDIFWKHFKTGLYDMGVDAWWMDATEPSFRDGFTQEKQEERTKSAGETYIGSFSRYLNTYSLEMMRDLYTRLRAQTDDKRVFIFTRSAFLSQQKYATAIWSGDVTASWENMRRQIPAGLNISVAGIPYWTSDTGGFHTSSRDGSYPDALGSDDYKELYTRWFQFGAFTPIFRVHGTDIPREIWRFGEEGSLWYDVQEEYIRLRYRLLPYIYSVSRMVTAQDYTMMRPLVMDFGSDTSVLDIDFEYMFGPAFLVRPVFSPVAQETETEIYLPYCSLWYDFHSGEVLSGGSWLQRPSVISELPLYVRAGSIIPMAEVKQWAMEYPDSKIELRVYAGADGHFLWYDDEGDSYRYEDGVFSEVEIDWDDDRRTLTIGERRGSYPGMPEKVDFDVKVYLPSGEVLMRAFVFEGKKVSVKFQKLLQ